MRSNKGFTLAELVVVLVILGIITIVIAPNFFSIYQQEILEMAIFQLHSDLRWAQQIAKQEGRLISVDFLGGANREHSYRIYVSSTETLRWGYFPTDVEVDFTMTNARRINFKGDGTIMNNGHVTLKHHGERYYLYLYQTGRMRISHRLRN